MSGLRAVKADGKLPDHFRRPTRLASTQMALFATPLFDQLLKEGVSQAEAQLWFEHGLLSFDPAANFELQGPGDPRAKELGLVRDVLRSGLDLKRATGWLEQLGTPYAFDPEDVVWSPRYGWVEHAPEDPLEVVAQHVGDYLAQLEEEADATALSGLLEQVNAALKRLEE